MPVTVPSLSGTEWTAEATAFCEERSIMPLAKKAIQLVQKHFFPNSVSIYLSGDPEGDGQWVVVRADVPGTVKSVLDAYGRLKDEWISEVPFEQGYSVRFLYNIV